MWVLVLIERLLQWWLDPEPTLADLTQTQTLLDSGRPSGLRPSDIESLLAERELQSYDQVNPYV